MKVNKPKPLVYFEKLPFWKNPEDVFINLFSESKNSFWINGEICYMGNVAGPLSKSISYSLNSPNLTTVDFNGSIEEIKIGILDFLKEQLEKYSTKNINLPYDFQGGFVGFFGYELKKLLGSKNKYSSNLPDAAFIFTDQFLIFDKTKKEIYLVCLSIKQQDSSKWFLEIKEKIKNIKNNQIYIDNLTKKNKKLVFKFNKNKKQYLKAISDCKKYLKMGESYQICLTNNINLKADIDWLKLYLTLNNNNPSPYSCFIQFNDFVIISSSPERFVKIDRKRIIESKPIKGTIKRGSTKNEDSMFIKKLKTDEKFIAENMMITDLIRNDFGKICKIGTIKVSPFLAVESYRTLHQLVSTVTGELKDNVSLIDAFKALFPGGSMTGAPKIRTMEIIEKIEKRPRGIYSGALGFLGINGTMDLSIVIRTIVGFKNNFSIGVGGAILFDSNPEEEYKEMLLKSKSQIGSIIDVADPIKYKTIDKNLNKIFLALGSNFGNKKLNIENAIKSLSLKIDNIKIAKFYKSKPMYFTKQENFLNTVISGYTSLSPKELLTFVKNEEKMLGRKIRFRNGPREIDIDIIFYGNLILKTKNLTIPHPLFAERDFVLLPLCDIAPDFIPPGYKNTVKKLCSLLPKDKLSISK